MGVSVMLMARMVVVCVVGRECCFVLFVMVMGRLSAGFLGCGQYLVRMVGRVVMAVVGVGSAGRLGVWVWFVSGWFFPGGFVAAH